MVFSSLLFVFLFLALNLVSQAALRGARQKNIAMLLFSLVFFSWAGPRYVVLLLLDTALCWFFAICIEREPQRKKLHLSLCVALGLVKIRLRGRRLWPLLRVALPVGISFYTFQILSYVVDVYRGEVPAQKSFLKLGTYIAMFPQLIAGPIVRYADIAPQLDSRQTTLEDVSSGACRFVIGLSKKVLLANVLYELITAFQQSRDLSVLYFWLYAVSFALQLYFDFSGYSDMAIGLGRIFGFRFQENFNYPYISGSITEFWRRWHISLGSWFRDYVYIPLGGNRVSKAKWLRNILVVWMLTGLWHGANWNFVLWGVYYGVLLMIEKLFLLKWLDKLPNWIGHIYSMFLVVIGWTIFAQTDIHQLGEYLKTMFGIGHVAVADSDFLYFLGSNAVLLVALIAASIDYRVWMRRLKQGKDATVYDAIATSKGWTIAKPVLMVVFLLVSFAFLVGDSYNPFLYFRF